MFKIVVLNLGFVALTAFPIFVPMLIGKLISSVPLEMALTAIGILACSVYLATAAFTIKSISDYGSFSISDFFRNIKTAWPAGLIMGLFVFLLFLVFTTIIPFYLSIGSPVGLILAAIIFWTTIFALLSFQFYYTVYARLGNSIKKAFKKCMIISLDNSGLAFFLIIHNILALVLSVIFAFLFPGPIGVLLYLDEALRLRLLKYDWLEANPGANRKKIPWDELLIDEREKTGTRTFRNFIFPWKD
jgi:hypothetical protein